MIIGGLIVVLVVILVVCCINGMRGQEPEEPKQVTEVASISGYGYVLEDRDTLLYKETFEKLAEELKSDSINEEEYAKLLGMLYIIDLYTIDNKLNKYDVGGVDFIWPLTKENFKLKVQDTIYKYVEDNSFGKRNQSLPEVTAINVESIKEEKVKVGEEKYDGYKINMTWEYKVDMGYDTNCELVLVKNDDKIYVVEQNVSEK